jgi:transcriptional regulator with GAF, ATPase, and Fis domain
MSATGIATAACDPPREPSATITSTLMLTRTVPSTPNDDFLSEERVRSESEFPGIVGQSAVLRHVLQLVETVAPTDSTALLVGETGTGKELIARAIHHRSFRRDKALVRVNCAAIPAGLLESELFGYERGAFTGAITAKIGRLEVADRGTLFSMKSVISPWSSNRNSSASCRNGNSSA